MNVGLVVPGFSADPLDWCIPALRHLVRELARSDDVRVIAVRYPYTAARYRIDGADVIALGGAVRRRHATLALWREGLDVLRAEHRRRRFDVLHAFWATESGLLAAAAGRLFGVPSLVSLAGGELVALPDINYGDQRLRWERLKIAASLRLATGVSVGSRSLGRLARRHVARPQQRLHWAPLGVDTALFQPSTRGNAAAQPRLVHAGTLTPVKDQATLLRAFAAFSRDDPAWMLDILGDGPLRPSLESLAATLGIRERVCFHGALDHAALPSAYQAAAGLVVSSRHEAQCMVALEAAACGTPVVGTRVGVLPEITSEAAAPGDVDALRSLLRSVSLHASAPNPEQIRTSFSLGPCTDRFRELYATVCAA